MKNVRTRGPPGQSKSKTDKNDVFSKNDNGEAPDDTVAYGDVETGAFIPYHVLEERFSVMTFKYIFR